MTSTETDLRQRNESKDGEEILTESLGEGTGLKRTVGLTSAVAFIAGTMIGSGIFISPKGVLASCGSVGLSLIVWALCGVLSMLGALCLAELGTLVPKMGAEYAYLLEGFSPLQRFLGPLPAFLFSWIGVLVLKPSSAVIISLTCAEYILAPIFSDGCGPAPVMYIKLLTAAILFLVCAINCLNVDLAARVQVFFTAAKLVALAVIIVGGFVRMAQGYTEHLDISNSFTGTQQNVGLVALAFYNGLWSYDGWNNLNYVTEEIIKPNRNLPLAIWIAIPLVTVCYLLTNISYFTVMSPQQLLDSSAVAVTWGDTVLGAASWLIPVAVAMSTFGAVNGSAFTGARLNFAAARERHIVKIISMVDVRHSSPSASLIFSTILSILWLIPSGIDSLIDLFSFTIWIFYGLTMTSLLILRYTQKDKERPYKVNIIIPIIVLLASVYLVIGPIVAEPKIEFFIPIGFIVLGIFVYVPFVYMKYDLPGMSEITVFLQLLLRVAPSSGVIKD